MQCVDVLLLQVLYSFLNAVQLQFTADAIYSYSCLSNCRDTTGFCPDKSKAFVPYWLWLKQFDAIFCELFGGTLKMSFHVLTKLCYNKTIRHTRVLALKTWFFAFEAQFSIYCSTEGLLFKSFTKCQESFDSASSSRSHLRYVVRASLYLLQRIWFMKKLLRSESSKLASRVEICRLADGACWRWSIKDWMTHDKKLEFKILHSV